MQRLLSILVKLPNCIERSREVRCLGRPLYLWPQGAQYGHARQTVRWWQSGSVSSVTAASFARRLASSGSRGAAASSTCNTAQSLASAWVQRFLNFGLRGLTVTSSGKALLTAAAASCAVVIPWTSASAELPSKPVLVRLKVAAPDTLTWRAWEALRVFSRLVYLCLIFAPVLATAPIAFYIGNASCKEAWARLLLRTLEAAGPAFIKWGQWAATRPDMFPQFVCQRLENLHTSAPRHPVSYSRAAVQRAFGRSVQELFDEFEPQPVASGSIAQVHRARLSASAAIAAGCDPGTVVAVKVRHPGVGDVLERDVRLMAMAAALSLNIPSLAKLRLDESIRQFGGPLQEQVDLSREALHLSRFRHNFRRWKTVSFPSPLYPLVAPEVLVETFEEGRHINAFVQQAADGRGVHSRTAAQQHQLKERIAQTGLDLYMQMLLKDNFIHADLHPGNILVRVDDEDSFDEHYPHWWQRVRQWLGAGAPRLVLLDTGMAAELDQTDQRNMVRFFKALTKRDGEAIARSILTMSSSDAHGADADGFVAELRRMFEMLDPDTVRERTGDVLRDMIEAIREHGVVLKSEVSTVVVTTLVLEGWSTTLHPDLRILDTLRDMLQVDRAEALLHRVDAMMRAGALPAA